ncbi:unnamed protein product [Larinioides sclopetarius]|uniref:Uncharacterized protein n=1 Tax=Larinioides sclopetarius TaxID=280406 RepID=A0AAV2BTH6_9ARAC
MSLLCTLSWCSQEKAISGPFGCPTRKVGRWSILLDRIHKHQHVSWVEGRFLTIQGSNCVQTVTKEDCRQGPKKIVSGRDYFQFGILFDAEWMAV